MNLRCLFRCMVQCGAFLILICTGCAELDALIPKTPLDLTEWGRLIYDRRLAILYTAQALINTDQLADKSMNRMDMEKLRNDYTAIRDLDKSVLDQLSHSITVGVNPADDYAGIRRGIQELHGRVGDLDDYLKKVSVVAWKGANANNKASQHFTHTNIPFEPIQSIWKQWQLKQDVLRGKAKNDLYNAALPAFEQLEKEFGR